MEQSERDDLAALSDAQLVVWLSVINHLTSIEAELAVLRQSFFPGQHDKEFGALAAEIQQELRCRSRAKWNAMETKTKQGDTNA